MNPRPTTRAPRQYHDPQGPPYTYVKHVGWQSVDLRLRQSLRGYVAHDVTEAQESLVVEFGRPSVGEGDESARRQLADEQARRQVGGSARTPELKLRIRGFPRISDNERIRLKRRRAGRY